MSLRSLLRTPRPHLTNLIANPSHADAESGCCVRSRVTRVNDRNPDRCGSDFNASLNLNPLKIPKPSSVATDRARVSRLGSSLVPLPSSVTPENPTRDLQIPRVSSRSGGDLARSQHIRNHDGFDVPPGLELTPVVTYGSGARHRNASHVRQVRLRQRFEVPYTDPKALKNSTLR